MTLAPSLLTHRTAITLARAAYEELYTILGHHPDPQIRRVADRVHEQGACALAALERTASDVSFGEVAAETLGAFLQSTRTDDLDAQLTWLSMLPDAMRDLAWAAQPQVSVHGIATARRTSWPAQRVSGLRRWRMDVGPVAHAPARAA